MKFAIRISILFLAASLSFPFPKFQAQTGTAHTSTTEPSRPRAKRERSNEEIIEAKAKGLVWVNSATRVYHKNGPLYGKTRLGKFMTEEDAKKAGYRIASENGTKESSAESK